MKKILAYENAGFNLLEAELLLFLSLKLYCGLGDEILLYI